MLELYIAIGLFGLGSYFNTMKSKEDSKAPDEIENIYEKKHLNEVPLPEEETIEQAIPRDFTEHG